MKKKAVVLEDTNSILWKIPKFIKRFIFKKYKHTGIVYIDESGFPVFCSDMVKFLATVEVVTYSEKRSHKLAFEYFKSNFPEYRFHIGLF